MIGLRATSRGLWVHGTVLPWGRIPEMQRSCAVNGGKLVFGPIGSGPMWGAWCCGKWGCTEAWRPDTGRGALTGMAPMAPMALGQSRQEADIQRLARALDEPFCIPASGWIKIIDKALAFASENTPYAFSFYRLAPGSAIASGRGDMARAKAPLEWWRKRLASEGNVVYCKGTNIMPDGQRVSTQDRALLQQAVMQPYIAANGIAGAKGVLQSAAGDLVVDVVSLSPLWSKDYKKERSELLPWWLNTDYLVPIGIGAVALGIFFRLKGSAPIIRSEAPSPEAPSLVGTPPERATRTRTDGALAALPPRPTLSGPHSAPDRSATQSSAAPLSARVSRPRVANKPSASVPAATAAAHEWAEYKRRLMAGEPRDGRRAARRRDRDRDRNRKGF